MEIYARFMEFSRNRHPCPRRRTEKTHTIRRYCRGGSRSYAVTMISPQRTQSLPDQSAHESALHAGTGSVPECPRPCATGQPEDL